MRFLIGAQFTKLFDAVIEGFISACIFVFVARSKVSNLFTGTSKMPSGANKQDYYAFFAFASTVRKDVVATCRAIIEDEVDNNERLRRALHAQAVVDEAKKNLRAMYFRIPEELKKASACLQDFLQLTKTYCTQASKALSSNSPVDWDAAKSTYTQSMNALGIFANELNNFALVMNNKADLLDASADQTEELARTILKEKMKEKFGRHQHNS